MSDYPSGPPNYGDQPPYGGDPPQWGPPPYGGQQYQQPPGSSGKAVASLVLGIVGIVLCPLICCILALVFGYQARNEIDASGGMISGRGMAKAGIILGYVGLALTVLWILVIVLGAASGSN